MYLFTYIYICIHMYIHAYMYICSYICVCIYIYSYIHIYMYTHMLIHVRVLYIYTCMCILYVHIRIPHETLPGIHEVSKITHRNQTDINPSSVIVKQSQNKT